MPKELCQKEPNQDLRACKQCPMNPDLRNWLIDNQYKLTQSFKRSPDGCVNLTGSSDQRLAELLDLDRLSVGGIMRNIRRTEGIYLGGLKKGGNHFPYDINGQYAILASLKIDSDNPNSYTEFDFFNRKVFKFQNWRKLVLKTISEIGGCPIISKFNLTHFPTVRDILCAQSPEISRILSSTPDSNKKEEPQPEAAPTLLEGINAAYLISNPQLLLKMGQVSLNDLDKTIEAAFRNIKSNITELIPPEMIIALEYSGNGINGKQYFNHTDLLPEDAIKITKRLVAAYRKLCLANPNLDPNPSLLALTTMNMQSRSKKGMQL